MDVSILQDFLLNPILGIDDPRTNKNIDFVGGIRGTKELEKLVNSGKAVVAFSLYPGFGSGLNEHFGCWRNYASEINLV